MNPNYQTVGGFLRSSAFSLVILGNLLFSLVFVVNICVHAMKPKQTEQPISIEKKQLPKPSGIVSLANIP